MTLQDGFHDVPLGKLATVVTYLEMHTQVSTRDRQEPDGYEFVHVTDPGTDWYRDLFQRVGGPWLWFSRLALNDADLFAILSDPAVMIWTLRKDGVDDALLELDFRKDGACELGFFGVTPALIGQGAGRFLMNQAIAQAWARPITRFHLRTCTLDSPQALGFYRKSGFIPVKQQVEIADDPRLTAGFDRALGAHIPIFE